MVEIEMLDIPTVYVKAASGANLSKAKAEARGTLERIRELLNKKDNAKLKGEFEQRLRELDSE
jgi:hypothetical protein